MKDALFDIFLFAVSAYFIRAVFISRIRMRWGAKYVLQFGLTRKGWERSTYTKRSPYMGALTCLGIALIIGGFALLWHFQQSPFDKIILAGFVLMAAGGLVDLFLPTVIPPRGKKQK